MEFKDYYAVMGLPKNASPEDIKLTYRKLARKYHPDVSKEPDAEEKFKALGEAYEVLKQPEKRAEYDELYEYYKNPNRAKSQSGHGGHYSRSAHTQEADFGDFWQRIFQEEQARQARRARDLQAQIQLSLEDAYHGGVRELNLEMPVQSPDGYLYTEPQSIKVRIPPGVTDGQHLRLKGQGMKAEGAPAGDLLLEIRLKPHPFFRPEGLNIHVDVPISPWEAALGADIVVPTLGGKLKLKIPQNAESGQILRLKDKGMHRGSERGAQFVHLRLQNPPVCNDRTRSLYEEMAKSTDFNPRSGLGV